MDSLSSKPQGFKPFDTPPCPGCLQSAGQTSQMPMLSSRAPLFQQTPSGMMSGPYYGTGQPSQTGMLTQQQPGMLTQQQPGMLTQQQPGMLAQQQPGMLTQQQPGMLAQQPAGLQAQRDTAPIVPWNQPMPVTTESLQYMNGFMRTQIGRNVTVQFLIGTNTLVDRTGTLLAVGANYILINELETDDILLCDFYSIKFMKFYY